MALITESQNDYGELSELQHALQAAKLELNLARSTHSVESVAKDEEIRKFRLHILLLEDENDELNEQLKDEETRSDGLQHSLDDALAQMEQSALEFQRVSNELRTKTRESENLKAEVSAMQTISTDSAKLLTEKLAMSRELSNLKPEIEHLRNQVATQQSLIAEKLSLQRQLTTIQVELENEKRANHRAQMREDKVNQQESDFRIQIEDLQKELAKEKRERERIDKALQKAESQLEAEKQSAKEAAAREAQLSKQDAGMEVQLDALQKNLSKEKREKEKMEKAIQKSEMEWEAQKSMLDEKLDAFRNKLRATKEKLKETETELQKAQAAAVISKKAGEAKPSKPNRKRSVPPIDPDAAIGTPGDGAPAKRTKRASSAMPGDKSTFSITPFLNRTANIAPDSPSLEEEEEEEEVSKDKNEIAEPNETPSAHPKKAAKKEAVKKPLATAVDKSNLKTTTTNRSRKKGNAVVTLEKVAEEGAEEEVVQGTQEKQVDQENVIHVQTTKSAAVPKLKPTSRAIGQARKSLASFATFNDDSMMEKKKKRKLGGGAGLGKTLFDEAEEDAMPAKPIPGKGLFAARALGKGGNIFAGKNAIKAGFVTTEDGFQFSPLKKDRRAAVKK